MAKHIPNILTLSRFLLIPVIVWFLLKEAYLIAIAIVLLSCFTDILDGYIARKFNFISDIGKLIDPMADKLTQIALVAVLTFQGVIDIWFLLILVIKDFIMIAGGSFLYSKDMVVSSNFWGKASTVVLYIAILVSMLSKKFNWNIIPYDYLYYIAIVVALTAFVNYLRLYGEKYFKKENTQ